MKIKLNQLQFSVSITEKFLCALRVSVVNLILSCGSAPAFAFYEPFDMVTMDYHTDKEHSVSFFGASAYSGLDNNLQTRYSVQIISQNDDKDEPKFYWAIASGARYRLGQPLSPFAGLGFSFGETSVCEDKPDEDEGGVQAHANGREVCVDSTLFSAYTEYGVYWLINRRVFIEISRKRNHTSKAEPFDSVVNGFSVGFPY